MTNEEALAHFKNHEYMTDFSWQDEMSEVAIAAIEKQIPKKPNVIEHKGITYRNCPACTSLVEDSVKGRRYLHNCAVCGQRICWEEDEE